MSLSSRLSSFRLCAFALATVLTASLSAQQPKVLAPHKPIAPKAEKQVKWLSPATQRSMVGGLWMTDPDFKSSIYIKNIVETDPITVTPILHLSNGAKYTLPDVTIKPADLAIISINDELQKKGISSWATLSGYVELQYLWPWNPFCATVRDVDVSHSLIFTYPLRSTAPPPAHLVKPISPPPTNTVEGMWWKQEKNVTGFIAVANLASQPANTKVQISDSSGLLITQHNITVTPHGMKLIRLPELQATEAVQGGVRIVSSETSDNLVINGGLEDQTTGYSASIPFASEPVGLDAPEYHTIAELGLMTGAADPMMLFPAGATFTPYTILRNVSDTQLTITPTLWWMAGGKPHSAALPPITLQPLQTQSLDLASLLPLLGPKNFNGSFNISFDTIARRASLVMSAGSVDQTGNYVFEIIPRGVSEGVSRSLQQWSTGNGDDTMITIWNPADEAQDFVFTLFFEDGHYLLPLHMEARETRAFNVSEILQNQVPDAEGNLIPPSIHQGTAKIAGSRAENEYILVAVDFGIYNVRKATCFSGCTTCDGYTDFAIDLLDFTMAVKGTQQETALGTYNTGVQYNLTAATNWTSNDSSVYTVSGGLVTGHAAGSATTTGTDPNVPYPMEACGQANCQETQMSNSAQGNVVSFVVTGKSYIFVGNDTNELWGNHYQASNGSNGAPQPAGGTCCGDSSDPSDTVSLTSSTTFQIQTMDQSATVGDRTLTFEYDLSDGQGTSQQMNVTAREFAYVTNPNPSNVCSLGYGTNRSYVYTVYTHPDGNPVLGSDGLSNTAVSENFNPPLTCETGIGNTILNTNAQFSDNITSACSSKPLTCIQTTTQTLSVAGYPVRTNTLQWTSAGVTYTSNGPTQ